MTEPLAGQSFVEATCRACRAPISRLFLDLGTAPPSNSYVAPEDLSAPERYYPLRVLVCDGCRLVQTQDFTDAADLFSSDYAYFSSYSTAWLAHSRSYVATMIERFGLTPDSQVVEVAANDGYLLQYVQAAGVPCYGIEPTASTASAARARGIEIVEAFFGEALGRKLAEAGRQADLIAANNVLAHTPDIVDFAKGFHALLKLGGVATFEFPHLLELIEHCQFDTVYHEHFSYLSLFAVENVFAAAGLRVFDVDLLPTHGGSLRLYTERADTPKREETSRLKQLREREAEAGVVGTALYDGFQARAERIRFDLLEHLISAKRAGKRVVAYGAAAKGATLFNYSGIRSDLVEFVADRNPAKQGRYMPGSRIPIVPLEHLDADRPDEILITPWNIASEIAAQLAPHRAHGTRLIRAVPRLQYVEDKE
jgi:hypothetical protein